MFAEMVSGFGDDAFGITRPTLGRVNINLHMCLGGGGHEMAFLFFCRQKTLGTPTRQLSGISGRLGGSGWRLAEGLTPLCCPRASHGQHQRGRCPAGARGPGSDV